MILPMGPIGGRSIPTAHHGPGGTRDRLTSEDARPSRRTPDVGNSQRLEWVYNSAVTVGRAKTC